MGGWGGRDPKPPRQFAAIDYGQPIIPIMVDDAYFFTNPPVSGGARTRVERSTRVPFVRRSKWRCSTDFFPCPAPRRVMIIIVRRTRRMSNGKQWRTRVFAKRNSHTVQDDNLSPCASTAYSRMYPAENARGSSLPIVYVPLHTLESFSSLVILFF